MDEALTTAEQQQLGVLLKKLIDAT